MTGIKFELNAQSLSVIDTIGNTDFVIRTPNYIDPDPVESDLFYFPIDRGIEFKSSSIIVPQFMEMYIYSLDEEELVETTTAGKGGAMMSPGRYEIDFTNTPMKLFLHVEEAIEVVYAGDETHIKFDAVTTVRLGARSLHDRPASRIVSTGEPRDLMKAISTFSSSLKSLTPERSFPTLRGHPPELSIGSELSIPSSIERPDTEIEIGIESTCSQAYTVAPLAFYLGAKIVPADGEKPYIEAADGYLSLDRGNGFTKGVHRTLERQFVFDCALRTEGFYKVELHERNVMEEAVDLDFAATYELPNAERVSTCFDLPSDAFARPSSWHLLADVGGNSDNANLLPYFVNDLTHIRSDDSEGRANSAEATPEEIQNFLRSQPTAVRQSVRSTNRSFDRESSDQRSSFNRVVTPPETEALGHAWVNDYFPIGAAKPTVESFQSRQEVTPTESPLTEVTVVCNEENMREESEVMYGFRDRVNLNAEVLFDLETVELREVLKRDTDFLHYIGHVDDKGMRCPDGILDLKTLEHTGVEAFFLNACESYEQGMALLDAGARGGIVTVADVYNVIATKFGRRVARLMDAGFDLYGALDAGQDGTLAGGSYAIVGDGRAKICVPTDGMPVLYEIKSKNDNGSYNVLVRAYPTLTYDIGTVASFNIDANELKYVPCGVECLNEVDRHHLNFLLQQEGKPLQIDGELFWSDNVQLDEVF